VWEGDILPSLTLPAHEDAPERTLPETRLSLRIMELGRSSAGPSWIERTRKLLDQHGPFALAWFEALLRISDWRGSAEDAG
jgi:CRISPR-associated endonuclease/helicase Cas3